MDQLKVYMRMLMVISSTNGFCGLKTVVVTHQMPASFVVYVLKKENYNCVQELLPPITYCVNTGCNMWAIIIYQAKIQARGIILVKS